MFSFIGYVTQEVSVGAQSVINVTLESDVTQLSEVVVTGYGVQSKESLTGSVGEIDAEALAQQPLASFEQSLQGNIAGVQATSITYNDLTLPVEIETL